MNNFTALIIIFYTVKDTLTEEDSCEERDVDDGETSNEGTNYSMFCIVHVEFTSHINRKICPVKEEIGKGKYMLKEVGKGIYT